MAPIPRGGGRPLIGRPYWMFGRLYVPHADPAYDRIGIASIVSPHFHATLSSNGEIIDLGALVAAHPTLPLPSRVEVTNLENGCLIYLRLNDRGPFVPGRIIDMTPRAAGLLGFRERGLAEVRVRFLGPAPLDGDDSYEEHFLDRFPDRGCLPRPWRMLSRRSTDNSGW